MTENRYSFTADVAGLRLDKTIAGKMEEFSRSRIQKLIEDGFVLVNDAVARPSYRLEAGDTVTVMVPKLAPPALSAQKIPLNIVYEDKDIVVVDKPAGLSVHPGPGHPDATLVNAILGYAPETSGGEPGRPGIVHRLDKNTSGLIIIARHQKAYLFMTEQFKKRQVEKTYFALVKGALAPESGSIDAPIGRDFRHRKRMAITTLENGREARTGYKVLEYINGHTLLEAMPETGRTHQIRVHLAAIGHPILGDSTYGPASSLLDRQFLHASKVAFKLPSSGEQAEFTSPLPSDLKMVLEKIRS